MFENVIDGIFSAVFLAAILRVTTPILLPSLGALISEKAGVLNIGLEGMMLSSAFTGVVVSAYAQDWFGFETGVQVGPWLGLLLGVCVSLLLSFILALFHLDLKGDLFLSGIALNIFGSSATVAIMFELTGDRGNTSTLASLQMPFIRLPEFINQIPLIGPFFFNVFDNQSVMTWIAFIGVFVVSFFLYRMPFGMHLRAVGENPEAAASVGINVKRIRYYALLISGFFAGLGGIHMGMGYLQLFQRDMTAGRGFIALVTPSLGGGTPAGTMVASLVFGFFDALGIRIGSLEIPSQLPQSIPYFATVLALVIYALQRRISQRVSEMRTASGAAFDAAFWSADDVRGDWRGDGRGDLVGAEWLRRGGDGSTGRSAYRRGVDCSFRHWLAFRHRYLPDSRALAGERGGDDFVAGDLPDAVFCALLHAAGGAGYRIGVERTGVVHDWRAGIDAGEQLTAESAEGRVDTH